LGEIEVEDEDTGETVKRKATAEDLPKSTALMARELAKVRKEQKEDRKLVETLVEREKKRADETFSDAVDSGFVAAGEQYAAIVGDGTWRDIDDTSAEAKARKAIFLASEIVAGDSPATIKKKVVDTTKALFGGLVGPARGAVAAAAKPASKVDQMKDKWKGAGVAQPTASRKEKPSAFDQLMEATGGKISQGDDKDETLDIFDE
jgi:hypothetical protein